MTGEGEEVEEGGRRVDLPEHLPPLLGAHACVFILSTEKGKEGERERECYRTGADKMRYPPF